MLLKKTVAHPGELRFTPRAHISCERTTRLCARIIFTLKLDGLNGNFPLVVLKGQRVRIGICGFLDKVTGIQDQRFCRLHLSLQIPFTLRKMHFSQWHRGSGTKPMTFCMVSSPDALPLSHRRLMGAKATKLGSWAKAFSLFSDC